MPGIYQGTIINTQITAIDQLIENIRNKYTPLPEQRGNSTWCISSTSCTARICKRTPQLESRLEAFEMAFKMQPEATDAFDLSKEPQSIRDLYGGTRRATRC